jgi:Tfp pilus assembly protein PilO
MRKKLQPREKKILILLAVTAVLIFGYMFLEPILDDYQQVEAEQANLQKTLNDFLEVGDRENARQKAVAEKVPTFKLPVESVKQSILFRDELTKQLQQCGLKATSLKMSQNKAIKAPGYNVWLVECQGQCNYQSMVKFFEEVKKNPYYAAIEKLTLKVDSKDRNKMTFQLVVSTYAI